MPRTTRGSPLYRTSRATRMHGSWPPSAQRASLWARRWRSCSGCSRPRRSELQPRSTRSSKRCAHSSRCAAIGWRPALGCHSPVADAQPDASTTARAYGSNLMSRPRGGTRGQTHSPILLGRPERKFGTLHHALMERKSAAPTRSERSNSMEKGAAVLRALARTPSYFETAQMPGAGPDEAPPTLSLIHI